MQTTDTKKPEPLFPLGRLLITPGAQAVLDESYPAEGWQKAGALLVQRHVTGDWGELGADDKRANDQALREGTRIFSAYHLPKGERIWIITEWDRSSSTILLPDEY